MSSKHPAILLNNSCGMYQNGVPFASTRWAEVIQRYEREIQAHGECSSRRLATLERISRESARKAINHYRDGYSVVPVRMRRGHGLSGVGSLAGMVPQHHIFLYHLYKSNPARPLEGYVTEFVRKFGLVISGQLVSRWFQSIGPYNGSFRETSAFPAGRWSESTLFRLQRYLSFISAVNDSKRLVFADEKPMKERDIYRKMRRDVRDGSTPNHKMNSNSKNRYNILAAVTIKEDVKAVEYAVLRVTTTAPIFMQFVKRLLQRGTLSRGDIFVVDNCSVHTQGDNIGVQHALWSKHRIWMIMLPPYSPEFNPTELVFNTLLQRLSSVQARYNTVSEMDFLHDIVRAMDYFDVYDVKVFYNFCGYECN